MKNKITLLSSILFFSSLFLTNLYAQDGSLDLTFGNGGKVSTDLSGSDDGAVSVVIQDDGKILVAGMSFIGFARDFAIVRYNTDGSIDSTFDFDGKNIITIGNSYDDCASLALQKDGKIVLAGDIVNGNSDSDFGIVRLNSNGSIDNTFDFDGKVVTPVGTEDELGGYIAIQNDGKLIVAGYFETTTWDRDFSLIRYNSDGSLDNTFDSDGIAVTDFGGNSMDDCFGVALQSDGKIVTVGTTIGVDTDFALARYNADGTLDLTFDTDGKVSTQIGTVDDVAHSVAIQKNGKILVGGYSTDIDGYYQFTIARYNTDGSLDVTFDTNGVATKSIGQYNDMIWSMFIQDDGKIVASGQNTVGTFSEIVLARFNDNGSVDTTFGTNGEVITPFGNSTAYALSSAQQKDGKIVVVGTNDLSGNYDFAMVRYNNTIKIEKEDTIIVPHKFNVYPNPFNDFTKIQFPSVLNNGELIIYDVLGRTVKLVGNIVGESITLTRENISCGMYIFQLKENDKLLASDKLLVIN